MKHYIATDAEAKALHEGTETMLVMSIEPQPDWGRVCGDQRVEQEYANVWSVVNWHAQGPRSGSQRQAPYAVGDIVGVKTPWYRFHPSSTNTRNEHAWDPFSRMDRLRILSVECRQVQTITEKDMDALGIKNVFQQMAYIARWDRDHPDHPWSANHWCWFYGTEIEGIHQMPERKMRP